MNSSRLAVPAILLASIAAAPGPVMASGHDPAIAAHSDMRLEQAWIPMRDGVRLAADLFLPTSDAPDGGRPVLLEYLPYRKDESRARNWALYSYFVQRGYIVARVDIRGTGNSEGRTIPYEYSDIELDDGEGVIDWLSRMPASNGNVGMFGISWGGFNAIQMAVRGPPALKAYIAVMATEDLYREDIHYIDGIIHTDSWMMSHDLYNAMPGAPEFELDAAWLENRFQVEPSVFTYLRHQRDGPFWDRASSLGRQGQIGVPGYHIGGWYDGYRNSLLRMLEHGNAGGAAPVKAMIGPWDHYFPHNAWPTPRVEWRREAVRWFDHWLRGRDTGILDEPSFAVYLRDYYPPDPALKAVPGRWLWVDGWPLERTRHDTWYARADHALAKAPGEAATHALAYRPWVGLEGGGPVMWWGSPGPDQRPMDAHSLVYDSAPLSRDMEILGRPAVRLMVSADAPRANWVVRLSDVAPDGAVTQVTGAAFNGTHRNSAREPEAIVPGQAFALEFDLHFTSWTFREGHRLRFAISNAQWPMLWPTPHPMSTNLEVGGADAARIVLPVLSPGPERGPRFETPAPDPQLQGFESLDAGNVSGYGEINRVQRDASTGAALGVATNSGATRYPWGIERFEERIEHRTSEVNPAETSVQGQYALTQELTGRTLRFEQDVTFRSDAERFHLEIVRRVLVDGELEHRRRWQESFPRDFQ